MLICTDFPDGMGKGHTQNGVARLAFELWPPALLLSESLLEARHALRRPVFAAAVVLCNDGDVIVELDPAQFGARVDVNVGRAGAGVVEGADADEADGAWRVAVVAPEDDLAARAAAGDLAVPAIAGELGLLDFAGSEGDVGCFDQRVEGEGRSGFALAPSAVAAVHEHRRGGEFVLHVAASAAARKGVARTRHSQAPRLLILVYPYPA